MRPTRVISFLLSFSLLVALPLAAADADEAGIRAAVSDYVDSVYEVDPSLVERSIHPHLQKVGYYTPEGSDEYFETWMNYYEFLELAEFYNAKGQIDPKTAPKKIEVLDRLDVTAVARVDAQWGIDFFHLAKLDGQWKIMNVIWQAYPPESFAKQSESEAKADIEDIRQAAIDYANAAYLAEPELDVKRLHPHVQKVGYDHRRNGDGYRELWMNYTEALHFDARWNADQKRFDPKTAKAEVTVQARLDKIALARLDAEWGVDFFHLAKVDGRWIIMNVIWQAYPKGESGS